MNAIEVSVPDELLILIFRFLNGKELSQAGRI